MKTPRPFTSILTLTIALLSALVAAQLRVVDLGALPDANFSQAWAINNHGEIAGSSGPFEGIQQHAALWREGEWIDLGTLPGHTFSHATDINKHGDVVGSSRSTIENTRAVLWRRGEPIDLGTLPGADYSTADAINDKGQVAGTARDAEGRLHLVRWDRDRSSISVSSPARSGGGSRRSTTVASSLDTGTAPPRSSGGTASFPS